MSRAFQYFPAWLRTHHDPVKSADIVVYRYGDKARAVDRKGNMIAESDEHYYVWQEAINATPDYGTVVGIGEFDIRGEINIKSNIRWIGGKYNVCAGGRVVFYYGDIDNVEIGNMYIVADNSLDRAPIDIGGAGVKKRIHIHDIIFEDIPDSASEAIWIGGMDGAYECLVENIWVVNSIRGISSNSLRRSVVRNIYGYNVRRELVFIAGYSGGPYPWEDVIENIILYNDTDVMTLVSQGYNPIVVDISRSYGMIVRNVYGYNVVKGVNGEPLYDSTLGVEDRTIIDNIRVKRVYRSAVYITEAYRATVSNVYAEDVGLINDPNDPGIHGIMFNALYSTIENCVIIRPRGHGIAIGAGRDTCIVRGNRIINPNYEGALSTGAGINLNAVKGCIIEGNVIEGDGVNMHYGINEGGTSDYNVIKNNIIRGYATSAINTVGTNTIATDNVSY